eukprot:g2797.t1
MVERTRSFTLTPKVLSPSMVGVRSSRWWRLLMGRETSILIFGSMAFNFSVGVTEGPEVVFFKERSCAERGLGGSQDYFGYTQSDMSNLLIVSCLAALVLTPILPVLNTYLGERQACVSGCIGVGLSTLFLVLGTGHKWVPAFCSGISVGLFGSMTGLGFMAMVHMCCPKDPTDADRLCGQRGTTRARLLARSDPKDNTMFGTLSPAFGGWLYTRDHFLPYGLSCGLAAVTAGVFASFAPLQEKHKIIEQEEVEPMIGKELESDEEDDIPTSLTTENLQYSHLGRSSHDDHGTPGTDVVGSVGVGKI